MTAATTTVRRPSADRWAATQGKAASGTANDGTVATGPADPDSVNSDTVALVDDHQLLVHTVSAALDQAGIHCVAVTPRVVDGLRADLLRLAPAVVLLDLDLGRYGDAAPLISPLARAGIAVLVLTGQTDRIRLAEALEAGAVGIQPKAGEFDTLVDAAQAAIRGEPIRPRDAAALRAELTGHRRRAAEAMRPFERLTRREQAVLRELADGNGVADMARSWVVSQTTVRSHVQSVLHKLGVTSQLEAVAAARRRGWLGSGAWLGSGG